MIVLQGKPGRTTLINNESYLFFSGYSYLGLGENQEYLHYVKEGMDLYGMVYPSSRISNTPLQLYSDFEHRLATLMQTEDAVCFSSGYLASRTAAEVLSAQMKVFALPHTHPSTAAMAGVKRIPAQTQWHDFLAERARWGEWQFGLLADSIYPTPGKFTPLDFLAQTPEQFRITLLVDDAHGIGWLGTNGNGIAHRLYLPAHIQVVFVFSMSKAYHMNAGVIAGSSMFIEKVRQHVNFTASTPPSPASVHAWLKSDAIFAHQRTLLLRNIIYLRNATAKMTYVSNEETPVFVVHRKGIAQHLLQHKIIISSFSYPLPGNDPLNRVVVNALHTPEDLDQLVSVINTYTG